MKVILKQNVPSLGKTGDLIKVNDGYGRNYLIPKGLPSTLTKKISKPLNMKKRISCRRRQRDKTAQDVAAKLANLTITYGS